MTERSTSFDEETIHKIEKEYGIWGMIFVEDGVADAAYVFALTECGESAKTEIFRRYTLTTGHEASSVEEIIAYIEDNNSSVGDGRFFKNIELWVYELIMGFSGFERDEN